MNIRKILLSGIILFSVQLLLAQAPFSFSPEAVLQRIKTDVYTLSSEEMEGREAGTPGELKAAHYIAAQMQAAGLKPVFGDSFLQPLEFAGQWVQGTNNHLTIGDKAFILNEDFFVFPGAATTQVTANAVYVGFGMEASEHNDYLGLKDLQGKVFVMEYFLPSALESSSDGRIMTTLSQKVVLAQNKGAVGVIFVNTLSERNDPVIGMRAAIAGAQVPVMFARRSVMQYWQQTERKLMLSMATDIFRQTHTGYNVAGYLDNQAATTVVIGGHYDHLGYGNTGSRSPGERQIHYGADDNASGTAGLIEAARYLQQSDLRQNNYLFIAFTAEEKGLIGSRYFTESDAYEMGKISYMFNFDMIGRMESNRLSLIGTGTSPVWDQLIDQTKPEHFEVRKSPGGMGGSDHSSFYMKSIPVIFFFTGIHDDYHRPGDTPDKVNYEGMKEILDFSYAMISALDKQGRPLFTQTPVNPTRRRAEGAPTLGLMPDHTFQGEGLKIQAVVENQAAQKAGIKDGDVIVQVGDVKVIDIETYMQALGTLRAGQAVDVKVIRNLRTLDIKVNL